LFDAMKSKSGSPPICSVLTARAPSGIAVVLLQGAGAEKVLSRTFRSPSGKALPVADRAAYGVIWSKDRPLDEVLVIRTERPPRECFEICCHGGTAASRALVDAFAAHGAVELPWIRLYRAGTLEYDLVRSMLAAEGGDQALVLARLMSGQLRDAFLRIEAALEKGVPESRRNGFLRGLRGLAETFEFGRILSEPPLAAITGPPNAGKSTLFNAILGESRALTSAFAGTTRDPVEAVFLLEGFPVRLADTPGAADGESDRLTAECVSAAGRLLSAASLEIRLADWEPGASPRPAPSLRARENGREVIHVLNKSDLLGRMRGHPLRQRFQLVSALRGTGVKRLIAAMGARLGISKLGKRTGPVLMNDRQARMVEAAIAALGPGRNRRPVLETLRRYLDLCS